MDQPAEWINDAVWAEELSEILIADSRRNRLSTHTLAGSLVELVSYEGKKQAPFEIARFGADYLIVNHETNIEWLNGSLKRRSREPLNLRQEGSGDVWRVSTIWSSQFTVASSSAVAIGGLRKVNSAASEPPWLGVFTYELPALGDRFVPQEPRRVFSFANRVGNEAQMLYRLGMPFLAGTDERAYFMSLEQRPRLFSLELKRGKLEELVGLPALSEPIVGIEGYRLRDIAALYAEAESLDVFAGIYAVGEHIYLLRRTPRTAQGGVLWRLYKLTPDAGRVTFEPAIVLPTRSEHIHVLPAGDQWIVFEMGRPIHQGVRKQNVFDVRTALVVPERAMTNPGSSPFQARGGSQPFLQCRDE